MPSVREITCQNVMKNRMSEKDHVRIIHVISAYRQTYVEERRTLGELAIKRVK